MIRQPRWRASVTAGVALLVAINFGPTVRFVKPPKLDLLGPDHTVGPSLPGPSLDQYGGLVALPSRNGANGFFRAEKFGKRWMFVTPEGHAFWMRSVQNIGDYFFPKNGKY